MSELARKRMTLDEFLVWNDGTDTRYELIDGVPVAMAPTSGAHQIVQANAVLAIGGHLRSRPPCHVRSEAGILKPDSFRSYLQADLAVTCSPHERGQYETPAPILIVEILSRSTAGHDRKVKLPVYRAIPSVQEILLIDGEEVYAEVHRRLDGGKWPTDLLTGLDDTLRLDSIGFAAPLSAFYAGIALPPPPTVDDGGA